MSTELPRMLNRPVGGLSLATKPFDGLTSLASGDKSHVAEIPADSLFVGTGRATDPNYPPSQNPELLFARFLPKVQKTDAGIEALENLGVQELQTKTGLHVNGLQAEEFLLSLIEAYLRMVKAIRDRHSTSYYREPSYYPEFDIYDSVHAIIEDNEAEELNEAFSKCRASTVEEVSYLVYKALDALFCEISSWNDEKQPVYHHIPDLY